MDRKIKVNEIINDKKTVTQRNDSCEKLKRFIVKICGGNIY